MTLRSWLTRILKLKRCKYRNWSSYVWWANLGNVSFNQNNDLFGWARTVTLLPLLSMTCSHASKNWIKHLRRQRRCVFISAKLVASHSTELIASLQTKLAASLQAVQQAIFLEREPASNSAQIEAKAVGRIQANQKQKQPEFEKAFDWTEHSMRSTF